MIASSKPINRLRIKIESREGGRGRARVTRQTLKFLSRQKNSARYRTKVVKFQRTLQVPLVKLRTDRERRWRTCSVGNSLTR